MKPAGAPSQPAVWKLWLNPIFRRYCRSRLRPRAIGVVLLLDLLVAGFIVAMVSSIGSHTRAGLADTARAALVPLLVVQGFILFIAGTAQVSGGMIAERDEGVIDYQRLVPMTPLAKTLGYLFGLPVREYVMFLGTLPFTLWGLSAGGVPLRVWLPLYGVLFTSAMLYHLTGLVSGMVVRNRRSAFLLSTGMVFLLYTIIPQAAKFGMVFFKYLTVRPVFEESLPALVPSGVGKAIEVVQRFAPTVKFFNLGFSETVFTLFTQGGLMLTAFVMLCRKWRSDDLHLLGKAWATGLFAWIHLLLLGNALPLIAPGLLFPSHGLMKMANAEYAWTPPLGEALGMSGLYGLVTLLLIFMLTGIITPGADHQQKGWRRALKQGRSAPPVTADHASSWRYVVAMAVAGGIAWFLFTRRLLESRWFEGQAVGWSVGGYFVAVLLVGGLLFQTLLEYRGRRRLGLFAILVGIAPLMVGTVFATIGGAFTSLSAWVFAFSPLAMPVYATSQLSTAGVPGDMASSIHGAFHFWLVVGLAVSAWWSLRLRKHHRELARAASDDPASS